MVLDHVWKVAVIPLSSVGKRFHGHHGSRASLQAGLRRNSTVLAILKSFLGRWRDFDFSGPRSTSQ
jgi:hypothetical protein